MQPLRWGIWGAGAIAADFVLGLAAAEAAPLLHVAARRLEAARALAQRTSAQAPPRHSDSLAALLDDPNVDAVYVATPHPFHEAAALACIEAGKAVLVEKPLAPNALGAARILDAAAVRGVLVREGYMYRCHPLLGLLAEELASGRWGRVRHLRANFGFRAQLPPDHRLLARELCGGGIWDVGGYPLTLAQLLAGWDVGLAFAAPQEASFGGYLGPTGVDALGLAQLRFAGGMTAELGCSIAHDLGTSCTLFCDGGEIELENPWLPSGQRQGTVTSLTLRPPGEAPRRRDLAARPVFALEADSFRAEWLGQAPAPHRVSPEESRLTASVLASWRGALGP